MASAIIVRSSTGVYDLDAGPALVLATGGGVVEHLQSRAAVALRAVGLCERYR